MPIIIYSKISFNLFVQQSLTRSEVTVYSHENLSESKWTY